MSQDCTINNIYDDLKFCKGKTVLPGLRPKVYYIPKEQIVKFPTLPDVDAEGATMASIGSYEGNFVFVADAVAKRIDILTPASNVTSASQGEKPSKTFLNSSTLKYAGNNAEAVYGMLKVIRIASLGKLGRGVENVYAKLVYGISCFKEELLLGKSLGVKSYAELVLLIALTILAKAVNSVTDLKDAEII